MSVEVYNSLAMALLLGSFVTLGMAVACLVAALVGWKGPYRTRNLLRFAILLALYPVLLGIQQLLLHQFFMPNLGHAPKPTLIRSHHLKSVVHVGDLAPSFTLANTDGDEFALEDLRGKIVLVSFFATDCGPCQKDLSLIQQIWDEHHENSKFALIAIGIEEANDSVTEFRSKHDYTFQMASDPQRSVYSLFAKEIIPRTYLVAPNGKICFVSANLDEIDFPALKVQLATQLRFAPTTSGTDSPSSEGISSSGSW